MENNDKPILPNETANEEATEVVTEHKEERVLPTADDDSDMIRNIEVGPVNDIVEEDASYSIRWMHGDGGYPTYEYGYRINKMTADNLDVDLGSLFKNRKPRMSDPTMPVITGSVRSMSDMLEKYPSRMMESDAPIKDEHEMMWYTIFSSAVSQTQYREDFYAVLMNDTNARWKNGFTMNNGKLRGIRSPQLNINKAKDSTASAVDLVKASLNIGKDRDLFLTHSGFSVRVNPPTLSQFMEVERKISGDLLEVGRSTRGLIFSHQNVLAEKALFDLFLECVESTSLGVLTREELMVYISVLDLPTIIWAMACAKYPNGFHVPIPCTAQPVRCNHVNYTVIAPEKLYLVDESKLTDKQRTIGSKTSQSHTLEDLTDYVADFNYRGLEKCKLTSIDDNTEISIMFRTPNVGYKFKSADEWITNLERACDNAFKRPLVGNTRSSYMISQAEATKAMAYEHFVEAIQIRDIENDEEVIIDDVDAIKELLVRISETPLHLSEFLEGVIKYINVATNAIIGIPNLPCPNCGGIHESNDLDDASKYVIPIDVLTFFSTLCQQQTRPLRSEAEETVRQTKQVRNI